MVLCKINLNKDLAGPHDLAESGNFINLNKMYIIIYVNKNSKLLFQ